MRWLTPFPLRSFLRSYLSQRQLELKALTSTRRVGIGASTNPLAAYTII